MGTNTDPLTGSFHLLLLLLPKGRFAGSYKSMHSGTNGLATTIQSKTHEKMTILASLLTLDSLQTGCLLPPPPLPLQYLPLVPILFPLQSITVLETRASHLVKMTLSGSFQIRPPF